MLISIFKNRISLLFLLAIFSLSASLVSAQTTEFNYQGRLTDNSLPANTNYDFEFRLFDVASGGTALGTQQRLGIVVSSGVFTVSLDFGAQFNGTARYLEIAVKPAGGGSFTTLNPRQPINSAPYNIRSLSAATADTATNATQLGGTAANQFVQTGDSRLSDSRTPTAGSGNYVQNTTSQQSSTNFNIDGIGTANTFNAATQFNLNGNRVLSMPLNNNLFVGVQSGTANITGADNAFLGFNAGKANTSGGFNVFVGSNAGFLNTIGNANSFFGLSAGSNNTIGESNTFLGRAAGIANTIGGNNTIIGANANVGANNLTFATAIGASAVVSTSNTVVLGRGADTVNVPGNLNVTGTFTGTLPSGSANYIQNTTTTQATSNFNISGNGTVGGTLSGNIVNAATGFNIGGSRVFITDGISNIFAGKNTGSANTTGLSNSFFGHNAGRFNTEGNSNSFFGYKSGEANTVGSRNAFFGNSAGRIKSV